MTTTNESGRTGDRRSTDLASFDETIVRGIGHELPGMGVCGRRSAFNLLLTLDRDLGEHVDLLRRFASEMRRLGVNEDADDANRLVRHLEQGVKARECPNARGITSLRVWLQPEAEVPGLAIVGTVGFSV